MRVIKEHLLEKFTEESDPISDMGIGMMHQIKKFLDEEGELNILNEDEYIVTCAEYGKEKFVKYLLDTNRYNETSLNDAFDWAAEYGFLPIVKMLLEKGADVNSSDGYAIRMSSTNGHKEIVKLLLDKGASPTWWNYMPLEAALENLYFDIVDLILDKLIKSGENVKVKNGQIYAGSWPHSYVELDIKRQSLPRAIQYLKSKNLFEKFVEDSDPVSDMGIGMIHQIEKFIKSKSFKPLDKNQYIEDCVNYEKLDFVKYLVNNKIYYDSTILSSIISSARSTSKSKTNTEILKLLLETVDKKLNLYTYAVSKALLSAVLLENIPVIKLLLEHGADPTRDWNNLKLKNATKNPEILKIIKRAEKKWKSQRK